METPSFELRDALVVLLLDFFRLVNLLSTLHLHALKNLVHSLPVHLLSKQLLLHHSVLDLVKLFGGNLLKPLSKAWKLTQYKVESL